MGNGKWARWVDGTLDNKMVELDEVGTWSWDITPLDLSLSLVLQTKPPLLPLSLRPLSPFTFPILSSISFEAGVLNFFPKWLHVPRTLASRPSRSTSPARYVLLPSISGRASCPSLAKKSSVATPKNVAAPPSPTSLTHDIFVCTRAVCRTERA